MEFRYSIQTAERLLRVHCWGPVTATASIEMMKQIARDPQYDPRLRVLIDLRDATGEWDYSEVQSLRDHVVRVGRGRRPVRWGALVSPGTLVAACHVMILITDPHQCGIRMRLFDDPATAEAWIFEMRPDTEPAQA